MTAPALRASRWRTGRIAAARVVRRVVPSDRLLPSYLIVGTKRGGSTSLHEYILRHPDVLPAAVAKGTRYFDVNHGRGWRWYESHFPTTRAAERHHRAHGRDPIVGEASPYYSFHPLAAPRIARELPDARLVLVVREPVERAWSHYRYEVARGFETLDIDAALDAEDERLAGEAERLTTDPEYVSHAHRHFSYLARGRYAEQIRRLWDHVGRDRLLVVSSERLFADAPAVLDEVATHLGLAPFPAIAARAHKANEPADVPDTVRTRLRAYYEEPNEELFALLGVRFAW